MINYYKELKDQLEKCEIELLKNSFLPLKQELEILRKKLEIEVSDILELNLSDFANNFNSDTADQLLQNDDHGVDYIKDTDQLEELLKKYPKEIVDECKCLFTENFCGYFNEENGSQYVQSTVEESFLSENYKHLYSGFNTYTISSLTHGILKFESLCIQSGVCGSLFSQDYYGNLDLVSSQYVPTILKAFHQDDKITDRKLDKILAAFDLRERSHDHSVEVSELAECFDMSLVEFLGKDIYKKFEDQEIYELSFELKKEELVIYIKTELGPIFAPVSYKEL